MANEKVMEDKVEAAPKTIEDKAVAEPKPQDLQKAILEQREMERKAKYDAFIAKAKERGLSEEALTEKVHTAYRSYIDNLDFHSIMGMWDATEISPLPIYMDIMDKCESRKDFLYYGGIFRANSRCTFKYPTGMIKKHAQRLLDDKNIDAFIGFMQETTIKPSEAEITEIIQDSYLKLAVDPENRYRMRNLIRRTKIAPDHESMKQAAVKMQSEGRYSEVRSLKLLLENELPKDKYCLHDDETALDTILKQ
ncbi:MAG: hypothetical protein V1906_00995 [Candidatus Woesearchaeota archaeon]